MSKPSNPSKNRFDEWIQKKALPAMAKVGQQTHLSAIRDGFAIIIPLIIASAVGLVLQTTVFGGGGAGKSSILGLFNQWIYGDKTTVKGEFVFQGKLANINSIFSNVFASMNIAGLENISIFFAFSYGYFLAQARKDENPIMGGFVSLAAFFLVTAGSAGRVTTNEGQIIWGGASSYFGGAGLLAVLLYGTLAVEIYTKLSKSPKLRLTMPDGVPEAISRAFAKLFPVVLTLLMMAGFYAIIAVPTFYAGAPLLVVSDKDGAIVSQWLTPATGFWSPADLIFAIFQSPLVSIATIESANVGIAIFYCFLIGFFWWFGLHGTNVVNGVFQALWTILLTRNVAAATGGGEGTIFVQGTFDAYVFLGGTEVTLGLIIAALIFSKYTQDKMIIRFATAPGIFNINEPIVFGLPLVANLLWVVPVIFTMPLLCVSTWALYKAFGTSYVSILFPWVTPVGIGALLSTNFDYSSFLIAVINLGIATLVWLPFVLLSNRMHAKEIKQEKEAFLKQKATATSKTSTVESTLLPKFKWSWSKFSLVVIPTLIVGWFVISVGATFGDSTPGIAMAALEGVIIILLGLFVFFMPIFQRFFQKRKLAKTTN